MMMPSLLSIFDPCSFTGYMDMSWVLIMLATVFMLFQYMFISPSSPYMGIFTLIKNLNENFNLKNQTLVFSSLFILIYLLNFSGLWPYVFSPTSHFSFNLSLSLMIWLTTVMSDMYNKFKHSMSHFTPLSCPMALVPFMVVVEIVSFMIRPVTLGLRLGSNMMAGHLILNLLASAQSLVFINFMSIFICEFLFLFFELAVAMIQAYVFSKLMQLYWSES